MNDEEVRGFLAAAHTGVLSTLRADGRPAAAPVWFVLDGGDVVVRTRSGSAKAAHVRRDELTHAQVLRHQKMVDDGDIPAWMPRFHGERAAHLLACWARVWQRPMYDAWDISGEIAAIRAPLLAIQGATDAYGLPDQLDRIKAAVRHAETVLVPGLGHFPHLEDAEAMAGLAAGFIARHLG